MKVYVNGNYKLICLWKNLEESVKPNNIVGGKNIIPWKPSMKDSVKPKNCIYKPLKLGYKYKRFILLIMFCIFYNPCQAIVKSQQLRISFDCNFFLAATHRGLRLCREGEGHGPLGLVQEMTARRLDFNEYNCLCKYNTKSVGLEGFPSWKPILERRFEGNFSAVRFLHGKVAHEKMRLPSKYEENLMRSPFRSHCWEM